MLAKEQQITAVSAHLRGIIYEHMRTDFSRRLRKPNPTKTAIKTLVIKFQRIDSIVDEERERFRNIGNITRCHSKLSACEKTLLETHILICWNNFEDPIDI